MIVNFKPSNLLCKWFPRWFVPRWDRCEAHRQTSCQAGQSSRQFAGTHRGAGEAAGGGGMKGSDSMNDDHEYWNGLAITVGAAAALCGCSTQTLYDGDKGV
jgi:hypothetical protein